MANEGQSDPERTASIVINVTSTFDVVTWAARLGVSEKELRDLIRQHGPEVEAIRAEIRRGET